MSDYTRPTWPVSIDTSTIFFFLLVVVGLPVLGYIFAVIDFRTYLRSLRRALIVVTDYLPEMPRWARNETPRCLKALGLRAPCTEEEVKQAYRQLAQELHPDRGGDVRRVRSLAQQGERALKYVREEQPEF